VLDVPAVLLHLLGEVRGQDDVEVPVTSPVVGTLDTGEVAENNPRILDRDVAESLLNLLCHCVSVSFRGVAVVVLLCLCPINGTDVAEGWASASCPALGRVLGVRPRNMMSVSCVHQSPLLGGLPSPTRFRKFSRSRAALTIGDSLSR